MTRWTALASLALAAIAPATARETLDEAGQPLLFLISSREELTTTRTGTAVHARELIAYRARNTGTLMSVFPDDAQVPTPGLPFGLVSEAFPAPSHG